MVYGEDDVIYYYWGNGNISIRKFIPLISVKKSDEIADGQNWSALM